MPNRVRSVSGDPKVPSTLHGEASPAERRFRTTFAHPFRRHGHYLGGFASLLCTYALMGIGTFISASDWRSV